MTDTTQVRNFCDRLSTELALVVICLLAAWVLKADAGEILKLAVVGILGYMKGQTPT